MMRPEDNLNDFAATVRQMALDELLAARPAAPSGSVNMHCHSFFSFNGYGCSPTALAWEGKQRNLKAMGLVDMDVLDGVDEFLSACDQVGLRGSTGIETRIYLPAFADVVINSPGEPGVCYHMGIGFTTGQVTAQAQKTIDDLRERATRRNQAMVARLNNHLQLVAIDFEADVLRLTPNGNATERHLLDAYVTTADRMYPDEREKKMFWAEKLSLPGDQVGAALTDPPAFKNLVRARLMKRGGPGYYQPTPESFPSLEDFHDLILACGAIPCLAWLDGTSAGEADIDTLLAFMVERGVAAVNIIPDRNWNIKDPNVKAQKVDNLYRFVEAATEWDLPINAGTELNKYGQCWFDDLSVPELQPIRKSILDGAHFIYGHTVLERHLGLGYQSDWASAQLPTRKERSVFYTRVGYLVPPGEQGQRLLEGMSSAETPDTITAKLETRTQEVHHA